MVDEEKEVEDSKEIKDLDLKKFIELMEDVEDITILILRTHLFLEYLMERMIVAYLPRGDKVIDAGNHAFSKKLILIDSFDIVDDEIITSIKKINKVRNGLAHELNKAISFSDVELIGRPLGRLFSKYAKKFKNDPKNVLMMVVTIVTGALARDVQGLECDDQGK